MDLESDPLMGRSLLVQSDRKWRDMRSVLSPLFTGSKMRMMLSLMIDTIEEFTNYVREEINTKSPKNGIEYNMQDLFTCATNDAIGSCAFGFKINSLKERNNEFYVAGTAIAYALQSMRGMFVFGFPQLAKLLKMNLLSAEHNEFFRRVIRSNVKQRKEHNIVRNDMIQLLLLAESGRLNEEKDKEEDQDTGFATVSEIITAKNTEKLRRWEEDDLVAQCMIFFIAGFTGIATTLCFLFHELAVHPDIQERLYEEIKETKKSLNGEKLTFEAMQKMTYLDMVVSEILRLWPISVFMERRVTKQYLLENTDGSKLLLQPDGIVWIPTFGLHRDPQYYPEPEKFDPERFNDVNKKNIRQGTYLPFGIGPRNCIASRFALMELKATAFFVLDQFKVECSPKTQVPLKLKTGSFALLSEKGFFLNLKIRN